MKALFNILLVSAFFAGCSVDEPSGSMNHDSLQSQMMDSSPLDIRSHAVYEYYDTTHVHPDSGMYVDRIHHIRFDSTDHVEIRTYSGRIMDPPTRYYISFYAKNNITLDSQYYFHAQLPPNEVLWLNRQPLAKYCLQHGRKTEIPYPY